MLNSVISAWKKYRSTVTFSCWLKNDFNQVAFAKVKAIPENNGYAVTSHYSKNGNKPIVQEVFMSKDEFFEFYRNFA